MQYLVIVLSWAGWIWTACFFAVVIPLLLRQAPGRKRGLEVATSATSQ